MLAVDAPEFADPSEPGSPVASLVDVAVVVSGRKILGPLSLELHPGEHWALLGPNGAGKTTLLSILGAERHPTSGAAAVLGSRLGRVDLRELRMGIGVVGHRVADRLPPHASALEIVLTGAQGLLAPWWGSFDDAARSEATRLLERLRCGHLVGQSFGTCSQGERQRVLLARSLLVRHRLLLLDEPALGVDLPGREALVAALDDLAADPAGPVTVHVAHTLEELPASTTHALLLAHGRVVAGGPAPDVLRDAPLSECYGIDVRVERFAGRFTGRAAGTW